MTLSVQEQRAEAAAEGPFASYSEQLAYGMQIIVVMGVFYLMGHLAAASMSSKASMVHPEPCLSFLLNPANSIGFPSSEIVSGASVRW